MRKEKRNTRDEHPSPHDSYLQSVDVVRWRRGRLHGVREDNVLLVSNAQFFLEQPLVSADLAVGLLNHRCVAGGLVLEHGHVRGFVVGSGACWNEPVSKRGLLAAFVVTCS